MRDAEVARPGRRLRLALMAPPTLLLLAGAVMLVASPLAWGAAAEVGQPAWATTFSGLLVAVPSLIVGGVGLNAGA